MHFIGNYLYFPVYAIVMVIWDIPDDEGICWYIIHINVYFWHSRLPIGCYYNLKLEKSNNILKYDKYKNI